MSDSVSIPASGLQVDWLTTASSPGIFVSVGLGRTFVWITDGDPKTAFYIDADGKNFQRCELYENGGNVGGVHIGSATLALDPHSIMMSDGVFTPGDLVITRAGLALACQPDHPGMRVRPIYFRTAELRRDFPYEMRCPRWSLLIEDSSGKSKPYFERTAA